MRKKISHRHLTPFTGNGEEGEEEDASGECGGQISRLPKSHREIYFYPVANWELLGILSEEGSACLHSSSDKDGPGVLGRRGLEDKVSK